MQQRIHNVYRFVALLTIENMELHHSESLSDRSTSVLVWKIMAMLLNLLLSESKAHLTPARLLDNRGILFSRHNYFEKNSGCTTFIGDLNAQCPYGYVISELELLD
jgi:hypothetical protein